MSRSEQNEVSEYHMLCKIFPYSISGDAFSWFNQLQPGSLTSWEDIERAFLYKFLDDSKATREKEKNYKWDRLVESWQIKMEDQIPRQLLDYIMIEGDEQHVSGELSRVEEADISDTSSASIESTTSTSTDGTTLTSTDGTTYTSTDGTTYTSIDGSTSTSIDGTTSTSTNVGVKNGHDKVNIQISVKVSMNVFTKSILRKEIFTRNFAEKSCTNLG